MAKQISVIDALAALSAAGLVLTDEHKEALAEITAKQMIESAVSILAGDATHTGKLVEPKTANKFANEMFAFAATLDEKIVSEAIGVRGGYRTTRRFAIETPNGTLKVELRGEGDNE